MAGSAAGIRAGRAFVELFTKDEGLRKGLNSAQKLLNDFGKSVQRMGLTIFKFGAGGLAALGGLAAGLSKLRETAAGLGFGLSPRDTIIANELAAAQKRLAAAFTGGLMRIGLALAPILTKLANSLAAIITRMSEFINRNRGLVVSVATVLAGVAAAGAAIYAAGVIISAVGSIIGGITTVIGALGAAWGAITAVFASGPLLAIAAGFIVAGGALYAFLRYTAAGQTTLNNFVQFLGYMAGRIKEVAKAMFDAFSAGNVELAVKIMWKGVEVEFLKALVFLKSFINQYRTLLAAIVPASLLIPADLGDIIADTAALAKAVGDLEALRKQAAKEAASDKGGDPFTAAVKNTSTAGTFNATHGISRLGNNDFPKRIANATESMLKLMQNAARGGAPLTPAVVK